MVLPGTTVQLVVPLFTIQSIVAAQQVKNRWVRTVAVKEIVPCPAENKVITISSLHVVNTLASVKFIITFLAEEQIGALHPIEDYVARPQLLPQTDAARWFVLNCIRQHVRDGKLSHLKPRSVNRFLRSLTPEQQLNVLTDLVSQWGDLGADRAMFDLLKKVTAL